MASQTLEAIIVHLVAYGLMLLANVSKMLVIPMYLDVRIEAIAIAIVCQWRIVGVFGFGAIDILCFFFGIWNVMVIRNDQESSELLVFMFSISYSCETKGKTFLVSRNCKILYTFNSVAYNRESFRLKITTDDSSLNSYL